MRSLSLVICILASGVSGFASGGTLFVSRADKNEIWTIDTATVQMQLVGGFTIVDPNELTIPQLALGPDGRLFGLSSGFFSGSLYEFDKTNGAATELQPLQQPTGPLGMATNPADGHPWWINTGGFNPAPQLYDIDQNTFQVGFHGNVGPFSTWFSGMAFDPNGTLYALETKTNALWVIDPLNPQGAGTHQIGPGFAGTMDVANGAALAYDGQFATFFAYEAKAHALFTIDVGTGIASLYAPLAPTDPTIGSIASDPCPGAVTQYGAGCAGTGGFTPELGWTGCPIPGSAVQLSITKGLGGSFAVLVLGLAPGNTPLGAGCSLLVTPLLPATLTLPLSAGGPGQGELFASFAMPPISSGLTITMQALVADPSTGIGGTVTNGVMLVIP